MKEFREGSRENWQWTVMTLQPELVTGPLVETARQPAAAKKDLPAPAGVRLEAWQDGLSARVLHVGPFGEEGPTIARLHEFIRVQRLRLRGRHREIYLSDAGRTDPRRLNTIIRQPAVRP